MGEYRREGQRYGERTRPRIIHELGVNTGTTELPRKRSVNSIEPTLRRPENKEDRRDNLALAMILLQLQLPRQSTRLITKANIASIVAVGDTNSTCVCVTLIITHANAVIPVNSAVVRPTAPSSCCLHTT